MKKPAPKRRAPAASAVLAGSETCRTVGDWLDWAESLYESQSLALGQIATTAHDEALYLLLHTLGIPMDCDESVLRRRVSPVPHRMATGRWASMALARPANSAIGSVPA